VSEHTPGPWRVLGTTANGAWIKVGTNDLAPFLIANVNVWPVVENDGDANARLIAAAPNLLEALRPFAALIPQVASLDDCLKFPVTVGDIRRAAAAIAAAEVAP